MRGTKNERRKKTVRNEDRISRLPDSILNQILSLTEIKNAVQSCVLSKRWRYVWTSLPNLDFDSREFSLSAPDNEHWEDTRDRFTNFVSQVLSLRDNSNIFKFRFSSRSPVDTGLVTKCICYAICHNVQQLYICAFCVPATFEYPSCFFTCETVRVLELCYPNQRMLLLKPFCLPALKTLHLTGATFNDKDQGQDKNGEEEGEFFSCFPNLENLILLNSSFRNLNISGPQLRNLEILIEESAWVYSWLYSPESKIVISTPRLASFKFEGYVYIPLVSSITYLPYLEKVYIHLPPSPRFCTHFIRDIIIKQRMPLNLIKTLLQFPNANSVTISLETLEYYQWFSGGLAGA